MKLQVCCSILLACRFISYGFSLTESESQNLTSFFLDGPIGKDSDVFRQLLNQETLIRMSLVKNVHSLMQDMVTLKRDMLTLKDEMASIEISLNNVVNEEIKALKKDVEGLKREDQRLNSNVNTQFAMVNDTFNKFDMNISLLVDEHTKFEEKFDQKREKFEKNISGILGDIKIEVRYLSVTLLDLNKHMLEMDTNLPKLLEENNRSIISWVNATVDRINDDLAETNGRQIQLLSSVNDLEISRDNITTLVNNNIGDVNSTMNKLDRRIEKYLQDQSKLSTTVTSLELLHFKERVAFTVGIPSTSSSWSGSILVFPKVIFEVGGGYDSSTGVFTSPTDGHFVFYIATQSYYNQDIYCDIVLNNALKVKTMAAQSSSSNNYLAASNMVVLYLKKGHQVWVQRYSGTGYYSYDSPVMTFSGFRIY